MGDAHLFMSCVHQSIIQATCIELLAFFDNIDIQIVFLPYLDIDIKAGISVDIDIRRSDWRKWGNTHFTTDEKTTPWMRALHLTFTSSDS